MKSVLAAIFLLLGLLALGLMFFALFSFLGLTAWKVTITGMLAIVLASFASIVVAFKILDRISEKGSEK